MFKLGQRYLVSAFVLPFLTSSAFFVGLLLIVQSFRIIRILVTKAGLQVIPGLMGDLALSLLPVAIPLALFFSTIYAISKLSQDSEIIAMQSLGMGGWRGPASFLTVGATIGITLFLLGLDVLPKSKTRFKNTLVQLTNRGVLAEIRPGQFFTEIPGTILFAGKVGEKGDKLEDIFIKLLKKGEKDAVEQVIFAKKGVLIKQTYGKSRPPALRLYLSDGNIIKISDDNVEKTLFAEYDFPILDSGSGSGLVTKDSMRSYRQLQYAIADRKESIQKWAIKIAAGKDDKETLHMFRDMKYQLMFSKLEYWGRVNLPLQCALFALLGFLLGIKKGRERKSRDFSFAILIGHYAILFSGVAFAKRLLLEPLLAVLFPSLALALLCWFYLRNRGWVR